MKTMTCKQLGGGCDVELQANTFEEIAQLSKAHVTEMFKVNSEPHLNAANEMKEMMKTPGAFEEWFENKRKEFIDLPESV